ncbi:MAG: CARDB domain-containing protein [Solirubrobacterales bacterium]
MALGAGLIVLIVIVLGVKGCLDARANRELSDYARNVSQIVDETQRTSKNFFERLEEPGDLSVSDFVDAVEADRSAVDNYAARIDGLSTPGDMSQPQSTLELVYQLRSKAMNVIANKLTTALGDAGAEKATEAIARQMQVLVASDVLYETIVRPEINTTLTDNGIDDSDVPKSTFVPEGTKWLDPATVESALGGVTGSSGGAATPGVHGLGLEGVSVNGTELVEGVPASVAVAEGVEVVVQVANQGDQEESGVTVRVEYEGNKVSGDLAKIAAGEVSPVTIPLTPTPKPGTVEMTVKIDTVPGEQIAENNEGTYSVVFE